VRLPEHLVERIVQAAIGSPACMNKGFILDGFPRHEGNAKAVFLDPVPGYSPPEEGIPEPTAEDPYPGLEVI